LRFDEEVENGIRNAAPFPKDKTGLVPQSLDLIYKMKESL
jgi:colicin import membrane protein